MRMKIRGKLLALLMIIALVPLGISAFLHYASMYRFGYHLAADWRRSLTADAHAHLKSLVEDFGLLQARNEATLEMALRIQAREVERLLSSPFPGAPREPPAEGEGVWVVEGAESEAMAGRLSRLRGLTGLYRLLDEFSPQPAVRRVVVLKAGIARDAPARADYPPGYDPRRRKWYREAEKSGRTAWEIVPGRNGERPLMVMAVPLRLPDGSFAGVTALEISLDRWLDALRLPAPWARQAEKLLVVLAAEGEGGRGERLRIVAGRGEGRRPEAAAPTYIEADSAGETASVLADIRAGRPGVRLLSYGGRKTHWVYGAYKSGHPIPLILLPHHVIIAQAEKAERHAQEKTAAGLKTTGLIFLGVIALLVLVAFAVARRVTRPLNRLAEGAERLAAGDYEARVEIRTGDEFQELGEVFNALGPKLRERERMARSLAVAREIQQRLIPQAPPPLAGFDIGAQSFFCDETGGDYYDFIELAGERLGVAVGDVSGHGIGAALLMTAARGVLRSYAGMEGSDPGTLFGALNRHLVRDVGDQEFMTLFYAEIDAARRSLRWSSAGHGPVFHYQRRTGEIKELPATGIPLGIVAEGSWEPAGRSPWRGMTSSWSERTASGRPAIRMGRCSARSGCLKRFWRIRRIRPPGSARPSWTGCATSGAAAGSRTM